MNTLIPQRAGVALLLVLSGCAGQTTREIALSPQPNHCQVTEVRPTLFSTLTIGVCWDESGKAMGLAGVDGAAAVSVPLAILGAGASLGSAYLLGSQLVKAAQNMPRHITGEVTVDPIQVNGEVTLTDSTETLLGDLIDAIEESGD